MREAQYHSGPGKKTWARSAPTEASLVWSVRKYDSLVTMRCLPDTVDPSGPKGK